MYFFTVFFDIPSSRATCFLGSRSRTQRIRIVSQTSNVTNLLELLPPVSDDASPSGRATLFRGGVNSQRPPGGQISTTVTSRLGSGSSNLRRPTLPIPCQDSCGHLNQRARLTGTGKRKHAKAFAGARPLEDHLLLGRQVPIRRQGDHAALLGALGLVPTLVWSNESTAKGSLPRPGSAASRVRPSLGDGSAPPAWSLWRDSDMGRHRVVVAFCAERARANAYASARAGKRRRRGKQSRAK